MADTERKKPPMHLPDIVIEFEILNARGEIIEEGSYRLTDYEERRAFAVKVHRANELWYEVRTRRSRNA